MLCSDPRSPQPPGHVYFPPLEEGHNVHPIYPDTYLVKVLGMSWNPKDDQFNLSVNNELEMVDLSMDTKRSILKTAGKIFDL
ncbi:hypothetical protein NPIL_271701 [Nephila pilipes]|uniref:Uncharacterized protein n=1 Tax=Nephila pilipes TaxID=299642 RepID=A0A8X6QY82_NEPPI|nr:hypothetical protein NPIL_271701 [Nephila pilipes]